MMNKIVKVILIIVGVLVVICGCASAVLLGTGIWSMGELVRWADTNTSEDPQEVARIAAEIANFDLPEGFESPYGMHFANFTSVGYLSQSGNTHIYLTQFPTGTSINVDEMMRMLNEGGSAEGPWVGAKITEVEQKPVMIRGRESTLSIGEGQSSEGETFRVATVTFQGKGGGPALLMVAGPLDEWDIEMVEALIASIQ
jgi:hypothetical protein